MRRVKTSEKAVRRSIALRFITDDLYLAETLADCEVREWSEVIPFDLLLPKVVAE